MSTTADGVSRTSSQALAALRDMVNGYQVSQALHVAANLRLADLLAEGPRTAAEVAVQAGCDPDALYRLMRALAAKDVLCEDAEGRFSLTAVGDALRSDHPQSVAPWARFIGRRAGWLAWSGLQYSIQTGLNAFEHEHGMDVWAFRAGDPEEGQAFVAAMNGVASGVAKTLAETLSVPPGTVVVDVGGGQGGLIAGVLRRHPLARGVLYDQPAVVATTPAERLAEFGERLVVTGGSFFDESEFPRGELYLLKSILHDWPDAECIRILGRLRAAMNPGGRVCVFERVLEWPNRGAAGKFSDLNMLVSPGGQERTLDEYERLFAASGLKPTACVDTGSIFQRLEAEARP